MYMCSIHIHNYIHVSWARKNTTVGEKALPSINTCLLALHTHAYKVLGSHTESMDVYTCRHVNSENVLLSDKEQATLKHTEDDSVTTSYFYMHVELCTCTCTCPSPIATLHVCDKMYIHTVVAYIEGTI